MQDKEEVQLVDMVLRIRNKLSETENLPEIIAERLDRHVNTIVQTLPQDLQAVLLRGNVSNDES